MDCRNGRCTIDDSSRDRPPRTEDSEGGAANGERQSPGVSEPSHGHAGSTRIDPGLAKPIVAYALACETAILLVAFAGSLLAEISLIDQVEPSPLGLLWGAVATAPLILVMFWSMHTAFGMVARFRHMVLRDIAPLFANCSAISLAVISMTAGLGEEALFRGVLQPWLIGPLGTVGGLIVASVLFGAVHLVTPLYGIAAAIIGLYLGALALTFDNLFVPILVHAFYDFGALLVLRQSASHKPATLLPSPTGDR